MFAAVSSPFTPPAFLAAVAAAAASDRRVWKSVALPGTALSVVGGDPAAGVTDSFAAWGPRQG